MAPTAVSWLSFGLYPAFPFELIQGKTVAVSGEVRLMDEIETPTNTDFFLTLEAFKTENSTTRVGNKDSPFNSNVLKLGE